MDKNSSAVMQLAEDETLLEFVKKDDVAIEKPIQELFDNCLNFISVCDFLEL